MQDPLDSGVVPLARLAHDPHAAGGPVLAVQRDRRIKEGRGWQLAVAAVAQVIAVGALGDGSGGALARTAPHLQGATALAVA